MEVPLKRLEYEALCDMSGEPTGEKPNCCWNGPAELMMGSSESWKVEVSMEKGTWDGGALKGGWCSDGWSSE